MGRKRKRKETKRNEHAKVKKISIMICVAMFGCGQSYIHVMHRDPTAKRNGFTQNFYIEILEAGLPYYFMDPDSVYMRDNAPIHGAKKEGQRVVA